MCGYRLWLIYTYYNLSYLNLFLRIFAMNYNNIPNTVSNMKKIVVSLAMFYSILNPDTTLAQNNNNSELDKQTEQCFKELRVCLETSPDTLKATCFDKLSTYPQEIQEEFFTTSAQDILHYNKSKMMSSLNDEVIEVFQTMWWWFFKQAWEMEKKWSLNAECEDILIQTYNMWGKWLLTKEALEKKIVSFNSCQEQE